MKFSWVSIFENTRENLKVKSRTCSSSRPRILRPQITWLFCLSFQKSFIIIIYSLYSRNELFFDASAIPKTFLWPG